MNYIELYNKEVDEEILKSLGKPPGDDVFIELLYLLETPPPLIEVYMSSIMDNTKGYVVPETLYKALFEERVLDLYWGKYVNTTIVDFDCMWYDGYKKSDSKNIALEIHWNSFESFVRGEIFASFVKNLFKDIDIVTITEFVGSYNVKYRD